MVDDIKSIWISFVEAVVRFWNNRFTKDNDEVLYLRMELDKARAEVKRLTDFIIQSQAQPVEAVISTEELKPLNYKEPWHITRQRLENDSRERVKALAAEAKFNLERERDAAKSTEQLEKELLEG